MDRIDIHIDVPAVAFNELRGRGVETGEASAEVRERVIKARETQLSRMNGDGVYSNSAMTPAQIRKHCALGSDSEVLLEKAMQRQGLSARAHDRILKVAQANGYLRDFPQRIGFEEAMRLPPGDVLIIATGGQGEPRAALGRIASGSHELRLGKDDSVIFSSRIIPGNEVAIGRIMNQLSDLGVTIVTERQAHVHVSGHPGRPELQQMYEWIRPQILVPVHGEARHLNEHARFARASGVPAAIVQKNGDVIRLAPGGPTKVGDVRVGQLVLDGDVILTANGATINERRKMSVNGTISVALAIGRDGRLAGRPVVRPLGVPVEEDRDDFIADAVDAAEHAFSTGDRDRMREAVRLAVRRCATLWTGKKPLVEVMLVETGR
jgi:ribonuclease J